MQCLAVYVKEGLPSAWDLSLENSASSCLCFLLASLHSVSYFFFLYRSPSLPLCTVFYSISCNTDEVPWVNPSANVFVFGDFNVYHKGWLTYSGGTDRPGELCYKFSISNDLIQIVNFPTRIPDFYSSPAILDLFLSSDASICSTKAFPPSRKPDRVVVPVSIDFPCLCGHLGDLRWEDIFNLVLLLLLLSFVSGFRLELMYISLIENIRSSLIHLHCFQVLVLPPQLVEITFFVCKKRINLLILK